MKQILFTIILFLATTASAMAAEWTKLGSRSVDFKVDRDTIKVGKDEGLYKAIKIDVDRGGLQMYDIKVTFGDGSSFSPDTRIHFKKGSLSRTIDLPGEARIIRKINFVYKSKGKRKQKLFKTKVHVYG
ncbi:MAG: hypothetical protein VX278_02615, partial [Myxococcota bacterium]|nr:hypothetical protein [Myxococcota bacterium]